MVVRVGGEVNRKKISIPQKNPSFPLNVSQCYTDITKETEGRIKLRRGGNHEKIQYLRVHLL